MPDVNSSLVMGPMDRELLWRTLCDFERYPDFMQDVLEVRVERRTATEIVSHWRVLLNGSELSWTERDLLTDDHRIVFEQTDGDLEVWRGQWRVLIAGDGSLSVELDVSFDLGIPSLAEVLHPIGERAIRANSRQMLEGIRTRMAAADGLLVGS
ncbi:Ribosome association toxin PasT (RatA) of the RatAB toxin-antitoxin module [Variovorax sp. YR266]|uniref:aromatase/cyclase n=1 Tax=Variovorax sp. YR266 TaxID=1884386 RepID=UPI00089CF4C6|nr:aromatase/cyclase [Variovorax sp. YR266]SDZ70506.1 Ribosome association toxin PasT (RatA) of the RatAB toxin-antitoxin module [Variovorax sp. YR266]